MGYVGRQIPIPVGQMGLMTDEVQNLLPPNALVRASNITFNNSRVEKVGGSAKFNSTALDAGIVGLYDWWPTDSQQRLIAVTSNGKVWRDTGNATFNSGTPIKTGLGTLTIKNTHLVSGGSETSGNNRKLFIFTGTAQVQVIDGDGSTTADITAPAADWATGKPTYGIVFANRLVAFGNSNQPHRIYISDDDDHEDFTGLDTGSIEIFPGDGIRLTTAIVYKGRLFLFKEPFGVYWIDPGDGSLSSWRPFKLSSSFGVKSPHAVIQVLDDLLGGNSTGSITSLKATDTYGDVEAGDILSLAQIEDYVRQEIQSEHLDKMHALYYQEKKQAYFSYRRVSSTDQDFILLVDFNKPQVRFSIMTKDAVSVLALRRDGLGISRPIYGESNGYVYLLDQTSFSKDGAAYTAEFQTPELDFSFVDPVLSSHNKLFDFLTVTYLEVSLGSIFVDVTIDGQFQETLVVNQVGRNSLDSFILGSSQLSTLQLVKTRVPLHGIGKTLQLRFYNATLNQSFKIENITVEFRISGEQED